MLKYDYPMTKKEIIDEVVAELGTHRNATEQVINLFLNRVQENMSKGRSVKLMGFGTFLRKKKRAKVGSDPNTQRRTLFKAKGWPRFVPSRQMKKALE